MADVMMRFSNDNLETKFLTKEDIKKVCPLAYVEAPTNEKVSDKYVVVNTGTVIEDMEKLGWRVVQASQRKPKKNGGSSRFSFHMVVFQNPDVRIMTTNEKGEEVVEGYPRVILTNSADGYNCFKFMVGFFRLVCQNGLVIATQKFADMRIRHINYNFEDLRTLITKSLEALPGEIEYVNKAKMQLLTEEQKNSLALEMLRVKKGVKPEDEFEVDEDTLSEILIPSREADKGDNLWSVWNTIQEKMIRGGYSVSQDGKKARKARPVKGFIRDLLLNKSFFEIMVKYLDGVEKVQEVETEA